MTVCRCEFFVCGFGGCFFFLKKREVLKNKEPESPLCEIWKLCESEGRRESFRKQPDKTQVPIKNKTTFHWHLEWSLAPGEGTASVEAFQFMYSRVTFNDIDLMAQVIWICYTYNGTLIIPSLHTTAKPQTSGWFAMVFGCNTVVIWWLIATPPL